MDTSDGDKTKEPVKQKDIPVAEKDSETAETKDRAKRNQQEDPTTSNNNGRPGTKRSRPKRNKKRPRSQVHSNENLKITATIKRLEMDGKPILDREGGAEQFIRVIHPYPYTFSSFAKQRWLGRTILDVYVSEFGAYPESYYKAAIRRGRILVSDNKVDLDYKIQGKDILTHIVHRHEPGVAVYSSTKCSGNSTTGDGDKVASSLVKVIDETDDLIILDKPGTLPIHPCGGYHLNSLTSILEGGETATIPDLGQKKYFNIHRLDRLTSGLVILAKSTAVAKHWSQCIRQRDCQKYYLARVRGKFPMILEEKGLARLSGLEGLPQDGEWTNAAKEESTAAAVEAAKRRNAHAYWITDASGKVLQRDCSLSEIATAEHTVDEWLAQLDNSDKGANQKDASMFWVHLACPTRISKHKDGVCEAGAFEDLDDDVYLKTVKPAQTSFGVVSYDEKSDSSLLLCRPVTGRTHQIRLHCQHLGHPIANDMHYGGDMWYVNQAGNEACAKARAILGNTGTDTTNENGSNDALLDRNTADVPASEQEIDQFAGIAQTDGEPLEEFIERTCVWCSRIGGRDVAEHSMLEFMLRSRGIWLHALQYCIGEGEGNKLCRFRTELPSWAC